MRAIRSLATTGAALLLLAGAPALPAAAADICNYEQVAAAPGPGQFITAPELNALLNAGNCQAAGDLTTVSFLAGQQILATSLYWTGAGDLVLVGAGAELTVLDGNNKRRLLYSDSTGSVTVRDLAMIRGMARNSMGGAIQVAGNPAGPLTLERTTIALSYADIAGAGVLTSGDLVLAGATLRANRTPSFGGGAMASGQITASGSQLAANQASTGGGLFGSGGVTVSTSSFHDNSASVAGGGIQSTGPLVVSDSTFADNVTVNSSGGGGVSAWDTATITNSTFTGNVGQSGGAVYSIGPSLSIIASTLVGDRATRAGQEVYANGTNVQILGSAVLGHNGPACEAEGSATYNSSASAAVTGDTSCGAALVEAPYDAFALGALSQNGGPTPTMLPGPRSPLIGAITAAVPGLPVTDQRGAIRALPNWIGAVQGSQLIPVFGPVSATTDGFTAPVTNYDPAVSWAVSTTAGAAVIDSVGLVRVTGLSPGGQATVTVTTSSWGNQPGTAQVTGAAISGPLVPVFGSVQPTADGYLVAVTNYDPGFSWAVSSTAGAAVIDSTGLVRVFGLNPAERATVTVTAARTGYQPGSAAVTGTALAGLGPQIAGPAEVAGTPGTAAVFLAGQLVASTVTTDALSGTVTVSGAGFRLTLQAVDSMGNPVPLSDGVAWYAPGMRVLLTGSGLQPGSEVQVWWFSIAQTLGALTASATGEINGSALVPAAASAGTHTIQVNGRDATGQVRSISLSVKVGPQITTKLQAVASRSKLKLSVSPNCAAGYSFRLQRLTIPPGGSDEPGAAVWQTRSKTYRTSGKKSQTRTVNVGKGTYRAIVIGNCGGVGTTTSGVRVSR